MVKDYKSIFSPKFHLLIIVLVTFQFFLWNTFLGPNEFFALSLTFELMIVGIPLTTEYYKRYNQDFFLKASSLNDKSKTQLRTMLFLIIFIDLIIVSLYHFIIGFIIQDILELSKANIVNNPLDIDYKVFKDLNFILPMIIFVIGLIVSIITTTYLLNHFIKNKMYVYGILIAFMAIQLIFGTIFNWHLLEPVLVNETYFLYTVSYHDPLVTKLTILIVPWSVFTFMINVMIRWPLEIADMPITNFWDSTYFEEGLKFLIWYPYVIIIINLVIPRLSKDLFKKNIKFVGRITSHT